MASEQEIRAVLERFKWEPQLSPTPFDVQAMAAALADAERERDALRAEVETLRKDKARLDFTQIRTLPLLRAALDAARKEEK